MSLYALYAVKTNKISRMISLGDCPWNDLGKQRLVINTDDNTAKCTHCGKVGNVEATLDGYALVRVVAKGWTLVSPNKPLG